MHPLTVHETIQRMHQKYLETETPTVYTLEEVSDRVLLIKRRLANLEKERCICLRDGRDVTRIDQKIAKQKEQFMVNCLQK